MRAPLDGLRRRRAASIAGYARVEKADPAELAEARQRGAQTRGAQLRGNSEWGRAMAEARRLKRYGPSLTIDSRLRLLERRVEALETKGPHPVETRARVCSPGKRGGPIG
jgi:hypothetical protein